MIKARHAVSILLSVFLVSPAFDAAAQMVDVSGCRAIEDRLQRFDCYERLEEASAAARSASEVAPPPPQAEVTRVAPAQPSAADTRAAPAEQSATPGARASDQVVDTFGTRSQTPARILDGADGNSELLDTVAALEQRLPNSWLVTLQSGQTWTQMIGKKYPLKVGDEVRIYPSRWGSAYRLTAARLSGFIQVERVE